MKSALLTCFVAFALLVSALPASAQMACVYAVHGIPGENGFPVDVAVNGNCVAPGFTFGSVAGPLSLNADTVQVDIYAANTMAPCSGTPRSPHRQP